MDTVRDMPTPLDMPTPPDMPTLPEESTDTLPAMPTHPAMPATMDLPIVNSASGPTTRAQGPILASTACAIRVREGRGQHLRWPSVPAEPLPSPRCEGSRKLRRVCTLVINVSVFSAGSARDSLVRSGPPRLRDSECCRLYASAPAGYRFEAKIDCSPRLTHRPRRSATLL